MSEFQDQLLAAIEDLTEALDKEKPAPTIRVDVPPGAPPEVTVEAPPVAPAPEVKVAAPKVTVNTPKPKGCTVEVTERDSQNFIRKLKITPN